jgi:outer membrane receptor protein involved in Fe transport
MWALMSAVSLTALTATASLAQTGPSPTPSAAPATLGEVVVTARKTAENIQSVPLTITAVTKTDLRNAGVQDLRDLTFLTPGLVYTDNGAQDAAKPTIRGQTDIGGTNGVNNVPVFFDGIFISNPSAIDFTLVDLSRVEVIEGPVSATYGRGAYAGAINYVSEKPSDIYHGDLDLTAGDYGKFNARGSLSGPIIGDILKGGVSASYDRFDGTYHDSVTNQDAGGYDKKDFLVNLDFTPNSHFEMRPVIYYGDDTFADTPTLIAPANCSIGAGFGYSQSFCGTVPNSTFTGPYIAPSGDSPQEGNKRKVLSANLQMSWTDSWGTITSLTGFNHIQQKNYTEFDNTRYGFGVPTYYLPAGAKVGGFPANPYEFFGGTPAAGSGIVATGTTALVPLHFGYTFNNHDFSQELRYSSPQIGRFKFSLGGYYADSAVYQDLNLAEDTEYVPAGQFIISGFAVPPGVSVSPQQTVYRQDSRIYAVFGSAAFDILSNLTLSTELRYTSDSESYVDVSAIYTPYPAFTPGCLGYSTACGASLYPLGSAAPLTAAFHDITSRTSLTYKFSPEILFYASVANGEKPGGFNNNAQYPTFNPETNFTYEIGEKSTLFDHRLLLNADVFYIDASGYQVTGPPPGSALPGGFITANYGGLSTIGFEASGKLILAPGVDLSAGLAYADPKFKTNAYDFDDVALCQGTGVGLTPACSTRVVQVGANQAVNLQGLRPPYESNLTFNAALDVRRLLASGFTFVGHMDYRYESAEFYQYPVDTGRYGPRNNVNLRVGVERGPYSVLMYIRNLTNDRTPVNVQDAASTNAPYGNFESGYYPVALLPDKRTFGATIRYAF